LRRTITNEGVLALWKGSVPACVGAIAENAVAFSTNGYLKRLLNFPVSNDDGGIHIAGPVITGGITGFCTAFVLAPCDIVKCRIQVDIARGVEAQTVSQVMAKVYKNNGLRGFYAGFGVQLLREIPFFASFFGSYEVLCQTLKRHTQLPDATVYFVSGG
jgi:hypothetical protein